MQLVNTLNNELRVSTLDMAAGFDIESRSANNLVTKYMAEFQEHGDVYQRFGKKGKIEKTATLGVSNPKIDYSYDGDEEFNSISNAIKKTAKGQAAKLEYFINEDQCSFLGTLARNSDVTVKFKSRLVKEFSKARKQLENLKANQSTDDWMTTRIEGKNHRREETDAIKLFVEYARGQGSKSPDKYYVALTKMENAELFVVAGKYKNLRDVLSQRQLSRVAIADQAVEKALLDGMAANIYYKDIFAKAKANVQMIAAAVGKSEVVELMLSSDSSQRLI